MIVIDASALVVAVVESGPRGRTARHALHTGAVAPHLVDAEVGQAVRGLVLRGILDDAAGAVALADAQALVTERYSHTALAVRAWELRSNVSFYDALYISLAETARLPLVTGDARLATATGPRCDVQVIGG
jgi:predicted nucleic acid-binding protein